MSAHFYRAAAMAYGRVPFDAKAVADNVEVAPFLSKLPFVGFVEGSDKGNTAKGGDLELIRAQVGVTEKA
jgi:cytochrome c556